MRTGAFLCFDENAHVARYRLQGTFGMRVLFFGGCALFAEIDLHSHHEIGLPGARNTLSLNQEAWSKDMSRTDEHAAS